MAGIIGWGSYIPIYRIKVEEIAKSNGVNPQNIINSLRVKEKSLPGIDEDTATMVVEAGRNAIKSANINPKDIGAVFIGSESHPYAVKPTGTILAEALQVGNNYTTADFEFACKAGTVAIQVLLGMVDSGMIKCGLAGGADTAQAKPGDVLEYTAAAAGAVFIIGNKNVGAEIKGTVSFTSDTSDFWRRSKQKYPSHSGSFTGIPSYYKHVTEATKRLMEKQGTKPNDYDHVIFHQPNGKYPTTAAKKIGFTPKQIEKGMLVNKIGNTYSASVLLGLANVLDCAKPGERILITSYGSGAGSDSFDILITDNIEKIKTNKTVKSFIEKKKYVDYARYLKNTGALK